MFKLFKASENYHYDMNYWRNRVCDSVFYFFSLFGIVAYIPSIILSIKVGLWIIVIANTLIYALCIIITFNKKLSYTFKAIFGSTIFYMLGFLLLYQIGPSGAGQIWLFATTIVAAMLLEKKGAIIAFIVNSLTLVIFYFLLKAQMLPWQTSITISPSAWMITSINFVLLNFVIVLVSTIFIGGFQSILNQVIDTRNASIIGLAKLAEYRDNNTGNHLKRLQKYSVLVAKELQKFPSYSNYITKSYIQDLSTSTLLHDIGKVGISDTILLKPGKLTPEEFNDIKKHPQIGSEVITEIEKHISGKSLYTMAQEIVYFHHEKWDGSGYPLGISGEDIPLSARIVAIVDVYDAMTSFRPYKDAYSHEKAIEKIIDCNGKHFDPDIVKAFINIEQKAKILSSKIVV